MLMHDVCRIMQTTENGFNFTVVGSYVENSFFVSCWASLKKKINYLIAYQLSTFKCRGTGWEERRTRLVSIFNRSARLCCLLTG